MHNYTTPYHSHRNCLFIQVAWHTSTHIYHRFSYIQYQEIEEYLRGVWLFSVLFLAFNNRAKPRRSCPYLSLVEAGVLDGAVGFVERLEGVAHVPVPQPGLLLVGDAEQLPHLLLDHVCRGTTLINVRKSRYSDSILLLAACTDARMTMMSHNEDNDEWKVLFPDL